MGPPRGEDTLAGLAALPEPPDETLALLLRQGDRPSFEVLVRRHHRRVMGLCYRMTGALQAAEDLVQETFLRVYRHRETYQSGRPFRAWLHAICINVCLTHRRRTLARAGEVPLPDDETGPVPDSDPRGDPYARMEATELADAVRRVLSSVPPPYRAALVLRVFEGLGYREIAEVLGCSTGTVMSRLNRARIRVRNLLRRSP